MSERALLSRRSLESVACLFNFLVDTCSWNSDVQAYLNLSDYPMDVAKKGLTSKSHQQQNRGVCPQADFAGISQRHLSFAHCALSRVPGEQIGRGVDVYRLDRHQLSSAH
jgi:hypothetical protein